MSVFTTKVQSIGPEAELFKEEKWSSYLEKMHQML